MSKENQGSDLTVRPNYDIQLREFETGLLGFLDQQGLPTQSIFVSVDERTTVFKNVEAVLAKVSNEHKQRSIYISKFVAAVASGLFDAALNYMWDETIFELRRRVAQYDLSYFYDNAVNSEKRKKLNDEDDLVRIDDSELIHGAKEIELLSELGFKHLDYIRYMRNWASAAHPNQNQLTGLQLISWLETCIKEVISLPLSKAVVQIKRLLANVKNNSISEEDAKEIAPSFLNLSQEQVNNLSSGFFGIYTRLDTTTQTRDNIHRLLPYLWGRVDEITKQQIGTKYGKFIANNYQRERDFARQFLDVVSGQAYIPDDLRVTEIQIAIENLLNAHRATNNFYSEPPFARQLQRLIGQSGNVPAQINRLYVLGLVEVFLTNGNGIAWNAEPVYLSMINQFDANQAIIAIASFNNVTIASSLQFSLCQTKYRELLNIMKNKISEAAVKELVNDILSYRGPLDKMKDDSRIKQKIANIQKIIS